jgi:hypothetical protein
MLCKLQELQFSYSYTYDLYGPGCNVFDACRTITRASGMGLGPGNQDFLGSVKWHRAIRRVPFGHNPNLRKNVLNFFMLVHPKKSREHF